MKQKGIKKKPVLVIIICVAVLIGLLGGFAIKHFFFGKEKNQHYMQNQEAIRLISYLGVGAYEYPERLGSSYTYGDMRKLFDAAGVSYDKAESSISGTPGFMPMSRDKFENVYGSLVSELALDRLFAEEIYIYQIDNANDREIDGIVYEVVNTSAGDYFLEKNYSLDRSFIGKVVKVYVSNNEMILCTGLSNETVLLKNAYTTGNSEENGKQCLNCYLNGDTESFPYAGKNAVFEGVNCIVDIQMTNDGVTGVVDHTKDLVEAKVVSYDDGLIMLDGKEDPLPVSESFNVYRVNETFKAMRSAGILIGYDQVKLYINNGMLEAALLENELYSKNIRVLINNTDYTDLYHNNVIVNCDSDFTVTYGDQVDEYPGGKQLEFSNGSKEFAKGNIKISAKDREKKIKITSIKRQYGSPAYRGTIELTKDDKGLLIINELPVEEYLYGVVPSEMPVNYETEALKSQAICARAYAFRQMQSDSFAKYGAHLDDSVASQVYNNVEENEKTNFAVDDTYGVVPCYNDEVIESFFFSTSCGTTSNNTYVWGGNPDAYLLDTFENDLNDIAELEDETQFRNFIDGKGVNDFYEQEEPFFRWDVTFDKKELGDIINSHLYERISAMSEYVLAKNADGEFVKKSINSIGDLLEISVTKRGPSGVVMEMMITGTEETILVMGQANARALLSPENTTIHKQDGSSVTGWKSLPSGYFYVQDGDQVVVKGGGFGHGVGMSQNGANDMAKLGFCAGDIISHYYTAVELKDMYKIMGK